MTWSKVNFAASAVAPVTKPPKSFKSGSKKQWPPDVIKRARRVKLPPLLKDRGYPLRELPKQNFLVEDHEDLVVKEHYWVWPSRGLKGNAIDFLMFVECRSFDDAMEELTEDIT